MRRDVEAALYDRDINAPDQPGSDAAIAVLSRLWDLGPMREKALQEATSLPLDVLLAALNGLRRRHRVIREGTGPMGHWCLTNGHKADHR